MFICPTHFINDNSPVHTLCVCVCVCVNVRGSPHKRYFVAAAVTRLNNEHIHPYGLVEFVEFNEKYSPTLMIQSVIVTMMMILRMKITSRNEVLIILF